MKNTIKYSAYYPDRSIAFIFLNFLISDIRRRTSTKSMSQRFARSDSAAYSKFLVGEHCTALEY